MNTQEARRLAVATIDCAVMDASGKRQTDQPGAVAWLASSKATRWFDMLDIDQQYFLEKSSWKDWARLALQDTVKDSDRKLIATTLHTVTFPHKTIKA